jgi:hypothetical protein
LFIGRVLVGKVIISYLRFWAMGENSNLLTNKDSSRSSKELYWFLNSQDKASDELSSLPFFPGGEGENYLP